MPVSARRRPSRRPSSADGTQESEIYSFEMEMEEEMLHLYHTIESLLPDQKKRVMQFIGSGEGEGTSTITREFARIAMMTLGQTVLLLDADRHNPTQHFFCNVSPDYCLDDVVQAAKTRRRRFIGWAHRTSLSASSPATRTRARMFSTLPISMTIGTP